MEVINIWKELLDAVVIFTATFGGVAVAIWADNKRENKKENLRKLARKSNKEKLVLALLDEVKGIQVFCVRNSGPLATCSPYSFEKTVIQSTTNEQIEYLENRELLGMLYMLREHCRGAHQTLDYVSKPNDYFRGSVPGVWQSNWQEYKSRLLELAPKLTELLNAELRI